MQSQNRLFDDFARIAAGAVGALSEVKGEIEARLREQIERLLAGLDLVDRDEFEAVKAMAMKREDDHAMLVGGDRDQVVGCIADLYIARRDVLRACGAKDGITVRAPTNDDAAEISRAIRQRLKHRGEIGNDEIIYRAIDRNGRTYDLPIAAGDRVRLFRRT